MSNENGQSSAPSASRCYAFLEANGTVDLDSIAETEDAVRWKMLEGSMGWRFEYPERYNRDEEWQRLLTFGKVVTVSVSVEYA